MRSMIWGVAAAACLAACGSRSPLSGGNDAGHEPPSSPADAGAPWSGTGAGGSSPTPPGAAGEKMDAAPEASSPVVAVGQPAVDAAADLSPGAPRPAIDAAPETDAASDVSDAAPAITCAALAAGGTPERLRDFDWEYQVGRDGAYLAPYEFVKITSGCTLAHRHLTMPPSNIGVDATATMSPEDCAAARAWATNARFLEVLRTGDQCPYGQGNPGDAFSLDLASGESVARKTYLCPEPTMDAERACWRALAARVFPN